MVHQNKMNGLHCKELIAAVACKFPKNNHFVVFKLLDFFWNEDIYF